jgi:acyl carrier protein
MGAGAPVDSIGFVTLLVTLEADLGNRIDLSEAFQQYGSAPEAESPFRTVTTLTALIQQRLTQNA